MDFTNNWSPFTSSNPFGPICKPRKLPLLLPLPPPPPPPPPSLETEFTMKYRDLLALLNLSLVNQGLLSTQASDTHQIYRPKMPTSDSFKINSEIKTCRLHISNIPFRYRREHLTKMFSYFGTTIDSEVIFNERGSKGFGFVSFARVEDAERAKRAFDGVTIDGRKIEVNYATPKPRKSKRSTSSSTTLS